MLNRLCILLEVVTIFFFLAFLHGILLYLLLLNKLNNKFGVFTAERFNAPETANTSDLNFNVVIMGFHSLTSVNVRWQKLLQNLTILFLCREFKFLRCAPLF